MPTPIYFSHEIRQLEQIALNNGVTDLMERAGLAGTELARDLLAGTRPLDRRIPRQQIDLVCDFRDYIGNIANFPNRLIQFCNRRTRLILYLHHA